MLDAKPNLRRIDIRIRALSRQRGGHLVLLLLSSLVWALLWAVFDIMVVRFAFPPPIAPGSSYSFYWFATWDFLLPLATLFAFREHAWFPLAAVVAGAWEDVLFYWLLGVAAPPAIPAMFYVRAAAFLPVAASVEVASHRYIIGHWARSAVACGAVLVAIGIVFGPLPAALFVAAFAVFLLVGEIAAALRASENPWREAPGGRGPS